MSAECLKEWLEAAEDDAAEDRTIDFELVDSGGAAYLGDGWEADQGDLYLVTL